MADIPMTYTSLSEAPKQMVGQKDKRLNETVTYIGSVDEKNVRKQRCIVVTILALCLLPALINPFLIILYCVFIPLVLWTYSSYFTRWEMYVTDKTVCHVNPSSPKGADFYTIPLSDIATVETRPQDRLCGCCCQMPGEMLVINIKATAPAVVVNYRGGEHWRSVSTRTYQIKFLKDADYAAEFIRQQIFST